MHLLTSEEIVHLKIYNVSLSHNYLDLAKNTESSHVLDNDQSFT